MATKRNNNAASATTVVDDICSVIATTALTDSDLKRISNVVHDAYNRQRAQARLQAQATLRVGTPVILTGLRPKALNGVEGTVASFNSGKTRCDVKISGHGCYLRYRWYNKGDLITGIPVQCCEVN